MQVFLVSINFDYTGFYRAGAEHAFFVNLDPVVDFFLGGGERGRDVI